MPIAPHASVHSERRLRGSELTAAALTWTISFEVPEHPGMSHGAHLFHYYAGLDVSVTRASRESLRVRAAGTAAELRRLLQWTDDLYKGRGVNLAEAFAGERFMEGSPPSAPSRQL